MKKNMEIKETFVMFKSNIDVIKELPTDAEKLEMLYAIADYSMNGIEPEFKSLTCKLIFMSIKPNIDGANKRYTASVENGKKGGAPKGTTPWNKGKKSEPKANPSEPKANLNEPGSNQGEPNANLYVSVSVSDDVDVYEDVSVSDDVSVDVSSSVSDDVSFGVNQQIDFLSSKKFTDDELGWTQYPEIFISNVYTHVYNKLGCFKSEIDEIKNMDGYQNGTFEEKYKCISQYLNLNYGNDIVSFDVAENILKDIEYEY